MKLTTLSKKTLEAFFENKKFIPNEKTKQEFSKPLACFVTLTKNKNLRGCIGSLKPTRPLYKDVIENTIHAAFHDPRFAPLTKKELKLIKIEISVLSSPKKLNFKTPEELLKKLNKNLGLILKKGFYSATFLPQVWKEIPNKINFLEHLSLKAGLDKNAWKTSEIFYYTVDIEKE